MLKKILKKIGYISYEEHQRKLEALAENGALAIEGLKKEILQLKLVVQSYEKEEQEKIPLIDSTIGDPTPTKSEERKMYVANVAGFFKGIMEKKLNHMISNLHNMLEERDSDRDFDLVLKGVAYAYRELIKWGNAMVNEQVSYQTQEVSPEEIETLQEKINKI